jgi:two-component system, chemotaxis family, protein-glutamate methylesterase/glutaminase
MDVEMPHMNGLTALKHIMVKHPVPTVMISALTTEGARTTFDAFKYGAIDVVAKPSRQEDTDLAVQKADIVTKVKRAAAISTGRLRYIRVSCGSGQLPKNGGGGAANATSRIIALGAGIGGSYALLRVLPVLPQGFQAVIVAVILMAPRYLGPFVAFLASHSSVPMKAATSGTVVEKGVCYVCSGHEPLVLGQVAGGNMVFTQPEAVQSTAMGEEGPIDTMFKSVARIAGRRVVGVVMSGPGTDGAEGLSEIRSYGGVSAIQEINNCTDPSMPLAALERGFVERILPDYQIADFLVSLG